MRRSIAVFLAMAVACLSLAAQRITLQIGSVMPQNSPWDLGLRKLAAEWSKLSEGTATVVFPKSVAGSGEANLAQKLRISLDGALFSTAGLSAIEKDYLVLGMPALAQGDEEIAALAAEVLPLLENRLADRYVIPFVTQVGWVRFFSNRPIVSPDDLKSMRLAVNPGFDDMIAYLQTLGIRVVKADMASAILLMNSGGADAIYSNPIMLASQWTQYRRVIMYMCKTPVAPLFGGLVIKKASWERVPERYRAPMIESARRIAREMAMETKRLEDEAVAVLRSGGIAVPEPDDAARRAWSDLGLRAKNALSGLFSREILGALDRAKAPGSALH